MSQIIQVILSGLRATTATFRRRFLLAIVVASVVAIPSYALIISNQTQHVITIKDITITASPSTNYTLPSGGVESGTVTVNTSQTFQGALTLSITNTTAGATGINSASFTVTIDGSKVNGIALPGVTTIPYVSAGTTVTPGYVFHYTVKFLGKSESPDGIWSSTSYQVSQVVSE